MANIVTVWSINPTSNHCLWFCCDLSRPTNHQIFNSAAETSSWLSGFSEHKTVFINQHQSTFKRSLNIQSHENLVFISLFYTPYEYQYSLSLVGINSIDDAVATINENHYESIAIIKDFKIWLNLLSTVYQRLEGNISQWLSQATTDVSSFNNTIKWLSREDCRIYPTGAVYDRHVYCSRWPSVHWLDHLQKGLVITPPARSPFLLKALRKNPEAITQVKDLAFILVKFSKLSAPVDYSISNLIWMSNVELLALLTLDPKAKYEIEDVLTFTTTSLIDEVNWLSDNSQVTSFSFGVITRAMSYLFQDTWTMAWWRSAERANWLTLAFDVQQKYPLLVSGYGNGHMSFYCWQGDMGKISIEMKLKASVIKHSDHDFDSDQLRLYQDAYSSEFNLDEEGEDNAANRTPAF